jgi:hypothetical protein
LQILRDAEPLTLRSVHTRGGGTQDYDGYVLARCAGAHLAEYFVARSLRKIQIQNDQIGTGRAMLIHVVDEVEGLLAVVHHNHASVYLMLIECFLDQETIGAVVLNEENYGNPGIANFISLFPGPEL